MKINVVVNDPIEINSGVYRTSITHPLLEGELFFIHSVKNRDHLLESISNTLVEDVKEVFGKIQKLRK